MLLVHTPPKLRGKACASEKILYLFRGKAWVFPVSTCRLAKWGNRDVFKSPQNDGRTRERALFSRAAGARFVKTRKKFCTFRVFRDKMGISSKCWGSQSKETGEAFRTLQNDALTNEHFLVAPPPQLETRDTRAPKARAGKFLIFEPEILKKRRKFDSPGPNLGKVDPLCGNSRELHYFQIFKNRPTSLFSDFQKSAKSRELHYFQIFKNRSTSLFSVFQKSAKFIMRLH